VRLPSGRARGAATNCPDNDEAVELMRCAARLAWDEGFAEYLPHA
jgi:hypothetical protein